MPQTPAFSAKVARPLVRGAVPRIRLFEKLDQLRERPVIWVCGPGGCGKTTLVSTYVDARELPALWYQVDAADGDPATFFYYMGQAAQRAAPRFRKPLPLLTPEYIPGLPTFTLRYFETLASRLRGPAVLVLDNMQEAEGRGVLHEVLRGGLSRLPSGLTVILVSRHAPPPAFARSLANQEMAVIDWGDLRLTAEESAEIARQRTPHPPSDGDVAHLHAATDGWVAGLLLILEWLRTEKADPQAIRQVSSEQIVAYFGSEVFDRFDPPMQAFLLKTALLPRMTAHTAEALADFPGAEPLLARLSRENSFTERRLQREPVYQYHPLFREFLLTRGRVTFAPDELLALRRRAATLLEAGGEIEAAAALLADAGNWDGLTGLVLTHAPSLLGQGRSQVVAQWIARFPATVVESTPWLLFWRGASQLPSDPIAAHVCFEKAFTAFRSREDAPGMLLAAAGAVDAIVYRQENFSPLDRWIGELDALTGRLGQFPSPAIEARVAAAMVSALAFRQPWRSDLDAWVARVQSFDIPETFMSRLQTWWAFAFHHVNGSDLGKGALAVEEMRRMARSPACPPLGRIMSSLGDAIISRLRGEHDAVWTAVSRGLEIATREGVRVLDSMLWTQAICSALESNDRKRAQRWLEQLDTLVPVRKAFDATVHHSIRAVDALIRGSAGNALAHSDHALAASLATGTPRVVIYSVVLRARALHALGRDEEAAECLSRAHADARTTASSYGEFLTLMAEADVRFDQGREVDGFTTLRKALELGRTGGYLGNALGGPAVTVKLCVRALEAGIEVGYVQELIRRNRLTLEEPPDHLGSWPWPLRVFTLGGFRLETNGGPVQFSRKVQQKPLLLLKALIAMGGADVREEQLSDLLWPDADGDAAHSVFTTTLSRLRDLLGPETAIRVQESRVTLDAQVCWVDAWAFERLLAKIERHLRDGRGETVPDGPSSLPEFIEKTMTLYPGHFLPGDEAHVWTASYRERLRAKLLRLLTRWGERLEQAEDWKAAVECYQRGLEVDELAEAFYQRLMSCYQHLGLRAEALATYARCKAVLSRGLGVTPSPKTEALARTLRG